MPSDTALAAELVQLRLLREKSPAERIAMALRLSSDVIGAARRAIAGAIPELTEQQFGQKFIELYYGRELAIAVDDARLGVQMGGASDLVQALRPVVDELNRLGVRYYVGGSIASSTHGAGRSTLDVDVVSELDESSALSLIVSLQDEYYVSKEAVLDAVRRRSCFNLIHLPTSFKVDVFISQDRPFDRSVLERAAVVNLGEINPLSARVASAEDIILLKLEWYRLGNETSERQWNDLVQVIRLQAGHLDLEYLRQWAGELGISDLLVRLTSHVP